MVPLGSLTLKGNIFWSTATDMTPFTEPEVFLHGTRQTINWLVSIPLLLIRLLPCELERPAIGTQPFESLLLSGNYLLGTASESARKFFWYFV